jgi:hypothetical protein
MVEDPCRNKITGTAKSCAKKYVANPYALQTRLRRIPTPAHKGTIAKGRRTIGPDNPDRTIIPAMMNATTDAILGNFFRGCIDERL